mgnify:FL=1|jgi:hypothetical protein
MLFDIAHVDFAFEVQYYHFLAVFLNQLYDEHYGPNI